MANISDTRGTLNLEGPWKQEQVLALCYVLISQNIGGDYMMTMCNGEFKEMFETLSNMDQAGFYGSGRWTFSNNLDYLHNWSMLDEATFNKCIAHQIPEEYKITYAQYLDQRMYLIQQMYLNNLKINWDFLDEDGNEFLCNITGYHLVDYNKELVLTLMFVEAEVQNYKTGLKNHCLIFDEGSEEQLEKVVSNILLLFENLNKDIIKNIIKQDPDWYSFDAYPCIDTLEDIPEKLLEKLKGINNIEVSLNEHIKVLKKQKLISTKNISDTYHTIGDLYEHRMALTIALANTLEHFKRTDGNNSKVYCYKSLKHHDDTMFEGMFIVVFETPNGQISYHYNLEHWDKFIINEYDKALEYDGHTPEDTIERLINLFKGEE